MASDSSRKPSGDVNARHDQIEDTRREALRLGLSPATVCQADHSDIRGRNCGFCGTYFRGDDMG